MLALDHGLAQNSWRWIAYHFAGGPRLLFNKSKVQRKDASLHALHGFSLSLVLSDCKHLILRVRQESHARLVTRRFGVRTSDDVQELAVDSAIWISCLC